MASMSTSISLMTEPDLLQVGVIRRPHGVKGDTYVDLITDREQRLAVGSRLRADKQWLTVTYSKRLPQRWLVHFEGFDDRTAVESLTNQALFAEPVAPGDDDLWVHQLVGAQVVEVGGQQRGMCISVIANPAHDILELESGALVPVIFVLSCVDGVITIDPPEGLFDLDS
jgi:16S rRNA processing protein RimM